MNLNSSESEELLNRLGRPLRIGDKVRIYNFGPIHDGRTGTIIDVSPVNASWFWVELDDNNEDKIYAIATELEKI